MKRLILLIFLAAYTLTAVIIAGIIAGPHFVYAYTVGAVVATFMILGGDVIGSYSGWVHVKQVTNVTPGCFFYIAGWLYFIALGISVVCMVVFSERFA